MTNAIIVPEDQVENQEEADMDVGDQSELMRRTKYNGKEQS